MSTLIQSTAILAFARFTNYAILLLSPVLLVRLLDPFSFGQYREFMVYAMLVATLTEFSAKSNLLYFIPKNPNLAATYLSHTNWFMLGATVIAAVILVVFRPYVLGITSFNFIIPLILFVATFINLDFLESYWIASKMPVPVLFYSTIRTSLRLITVVGAAALTHSVVAILYSIIAVEAVRMIVVLAIMKRTDLLSFALVPAVFREQMAFVVPLGFATAIQSLNRYVGQIAISSQLGVVALAVYSIGSYQVPVLNIVRRAISDAIFPDMVREAAHESNDRLRLWKRGNVAYTFLVVPIFVVLMWYADLLIPLVFTTRYAEAVPIFRILLLVMFIQCFELSSPLRAVNRNRVLLVSNLVMLLTNVGCIFIFFRFLNPFSILGPAIGIVLGNVVQRAPLSWYVIHAYSTTLRQLLKWRSLASIILSAAACTPILLAGEFLPVSDAARFVVSSIFFSMGYFFLIRRARLEEVDALTKFIGQKLRIEAR